jgi:hypothetical protein
MLEEKLKNIYDRVRNKKKAIFQNLQEIIKILI